MNKRLTIIIVILLIVAGYLSLSYWHIFSKVINQGLKAPDDNGTYVLGSDSATKQIKYVAMGDSLTAGVGITDYTKSYPYIIAQKMASQGEKVTFYDVSHPGVKIADLRAYLLGQALSSKPDIITLLIGVNDIRNYTDENKFSEDYEYVLKTLSQETDAEIYAVSIPFIGDDILPPYSEYFRGKTKDFNKIILRLCQKYGIKYIDIYTKTLSEFSKSEDYYSSDLYHPSAKGYALWAEIIYDDINK